MAAETAIEMPDLAKKELARQPSSLAQRGTTFVFEHISVTVNTKAGPKKILDDVSGASEWWVIFPALPP